MGHWLHYLPSACPKLPKACLGLAALPLGFRVCGGSQLEPTWPWPGRLAGLAKLWLRSFSAWNVLCVGGVFLAFMLPEECETS